VARILRESYPDFGPTLAMEKLAERHQIQLAKETGGRRTRGSASHEPRCELRVNLGGKTEKGRIVQNAGVHCWGLSGVVTGDSPEGLL
jgi:hypothetical protein